MAKVAKQDYNILVGGVGLLLEKEYLGYLIYRNSSCCLDYRSTGLQC